MTPTPAPVWIVVWWYRTWKDEPWEQTHETFMAQATAETWASGVRNKRDHVERIVNDPVQFTPQEPKK